MYQFEPHLTDIVRIMVSKDVTYYIADSTKSKNLYHRKYRGISLDIGIYNLKNNHWISIL